MNICTFTGENQTVTKTFDMTTGYKVTELFCIIDEFCKHLLLSVLHQGYDEVVFSEGRVL